MVMVIKVAVKMLMLVTLYLCSTGYSETLYASAITKDGSLLDLDMGLILQRDKVVAVDTEYSMVSTFLKLDIPQLNCSKDNSLSHSLHNKIQEKVDLFNGLNPMKVTNRTSKRSILAALGGTLLLTAFSAIGDVIIYRKLRGINKDFLKFAHQTHRFEKKQLYINNKIIHILWQAKENFEIIQCQQRGIMSLIFWKSWKKRSRV